MDATQKANVHKLIQKAADTGEAAQAAGFSQSACNAANALRVLAEIEHAGKPPQG
jgi:hypothetical protein